MSAQPVRVRVSGGWGSPSSQPTVRLPAPAAPVAVAGGEGGGHPGAEADQEGARLAGDGVEGEVAEGRGQDEGAGGVEARLHPRLVAVAAQEAGDLPGLGAGPEPGAELGQDGADLALGGLVAGVGGVLQPQRRLERRSRPRPA